MTIDETFKPGEAYKSKELRKKKYDYIHTQVHLAKKSIMSDETTAHHVVAGAKFAGIDKAGHKWFQHYHISDHATKEEAEASAKKHAEKHGLKLSHSDSKGTHYTRGGVHPDKLEEEVKMTNFLEETISYEQDGFLVEEIYTIDEAKGKASIETIVRDKESGEPIRTHKRAVSRDFAAHRLRRLRKAMSTEPGEDASSPAGEDDDGMIITSHQHPVKSKRGNKSYIYHRGKIGGSTHVVNVKKNTNEEVEEVPMANFIEFAEQKDAAGFEAALHERLAVKIHDVLDGLREIVASSMFENAIDTPGSVPTGGIKVSGKVEYKPAPPSSIKTPGNSGKGTVVGHGKPDKTEGALDPNCPEFNLKGAAKIPANEDVEFTDEELQTLIGRVGKERIHQLSK